MQQPATWDEDLIKAWLVEAADTLRRLPPGHAKARLTYWPDVVQTSVYSFGGASRRGTRAAPSPKSIDRMERVLVWLMACDGDARPIVWARACGIPWRYLEDVDGRSHVTLRKVHGRGLRDIHRYLCDHPKEAPAA